MDVPQARVVAAVGHLPESPVIQVSIIIPVYNDAKLLSETLTVLSQKIANQPEVEIIICDGGSSDNVFEVAKLNSCHYVTSPPGRSVQMNAGAQIARGQILLFLHADSYLPDNWLQHIRRVNSWGFFRLRLSGKHWLFRVIEQFIQFRSALSRIGTGDQGLIFVKSFFNQINGFPPIPLMEDIAICKRAKRHHVPNIISDPIVTSSRRWEQNGIIRTVILMWKIRFLYWIGVSTDCLHRKYYPQHYR
jgi:rSAM/selenodomain-associated transferase 2